jgi:hypothetical protein
MIGPVLPGLNDAEIPRILEAAARAGAQSASWVLLRLPKPVDELFERWLVEHFPENPSGPANATPPASTIAASVSLPRSVVMTLPSFRGAQAATRRLAAASTGREHHPLPAESAYAARRVSRRRESAWPLARRDLNRAEGVPPPRSAPGAEGGFRLDLPALLRMTPSA